MLKCLDLFSYLPKILSFPLIAVVLAFSGALAFYKVHSKPFVFLVENFLKYVMSGKLYIWSKQKKEVQQRETTAGNGPLYVPKITDSKLKDLSWNLDVKDPTNPL